MDTVLVKLLVSRSGTDGAFAPGDHIEAPENEVLPMLDGGQIDPEFGVAAEMAAARLAAAQDAAEAAAPASKVDAPAVKARAKAKVETAAATVATETAAG